jgi:hypothetical protein
VGVEMAVASTPVPAAQTGSSTATCPGSCVPTAADDEGELLEASRAPASALPATTSAATLAAAVLTARNADPSIGGRLTSLRHPAMMAVPPAVVPGPDAHAIQVSSNVGLPLAKWWDLRGAQ